MSAEPQFEQKAVAAAPAVEPVVTPVQTGETITQIEGGVAKSSSAEKLPTIDEEGKTAAGEEKKKVPAGEKIKAVIAKVKTLLSCIKIAKREKPAKEASAEEDKTEEGKKEEDKKEAAAAAEDKKDEEVKKDESVAPTLPPVGSTAAPAEEAKN
ncbi:hypothetical protein QBC37DRAFT_398317 [Rhypophila decipiens]|uniref:Uncharacterized protein n=1 Tax=Rhypophila decipiens TaxID=261697 RepID=A0AAN7B7M2_9PEZI|nr:hypothetical protein QBC37DRAFT_398317 [Rhypophila decipiens]